MARQPIFDAHMNVYGYELLFRSNLDNFFQHVDGDQATSHVMADSFLVFGINTLTGGARAFINFTKKTLLSGCAAALPADHIVVELLENVPPSEEVFAACRRLRSQGYVLALDDFVYSEEYRPLAEFADIIKVDFRASGIEERRWLGEFFLPAGKRLLGEKMETREEFDQAVETGYSLFQGYFFCRPLMIARRDVAGQKVHYLQVLREINRPDVDFGKLARVIRNDVSLAYKLLKYINAAAFGFRREITSIEQAVALLGEREIRKWASLIALARMGEDKPGELIVTSLLRARLAEGVAEPLGMKGRSGDLFLMGLLSLVDAIVGRPIAELLEELPLCDEIRDALTERKGRFGQVLTLVEAMEKGEWDKMDETAAGLRIEESRLPAIYMDAVATVDNALKAA